ncbi:MAG: hypothetical protein HUU35_09050 [Armatimonadetes bacterium]|nr:hypothetical protein [Armatimonadota bacterium]
MRIGHLCFCAILLTPAAGAWADNLDTPTPKVEQSFELKYEARDTAAADLDRFVFTTSYRWETGRRGSLAVVLPYQRIEVDPVGAPELSAHGLMDMSVSYTFNVRDLNRRGTSAHWELRGNVPMGKATLDGNEFAALNALNASAEGFINPQFGRGAGLGVFHHWASQHGTRKTNWYLGGTWNGSYQISDAPGFDRSNSGIDTYEAGVGWQIEKGRRVWDLGLDIVGFRESETVTNGVRTVIDSDPNYTFRAGLALNHTDRITSNFRLTYQDRDVQDSSQPGVLVNPASVELGDRIFWEAFIERRNNVHDKWILGTVGLRTMGAHQGGIDLPGSDRHEEFARLGYDRSGDNGRGWSITSDFGLSSDARDLVTVARFYRKF